MLTLKIAMLGQQESREKDDWLPVRNAQPTTSEEKAAETKICSIRIPELRFCWVDGQYALFNGDKIIKLQSGQHILVGDYDITVNIERESLQEIPEKTLMDNLVLKGLNLADSPGPKMPQLNNPSNASLDTKNHDDQLAFLYGNASSFNTKVRLDKPEENQQGDVFLELTKEGNRANQKIDALSYREGNILAELGFLEK